MGKAMKRCVAAMGTLLIVWLLAIHLPPAQAAGNVDVTFRIKCVLQVENPDTASGDGDYFAEVKIGNHPFTIHPTYHGPLGPGPIQDDSFCPDWRFTQSVDRGEPVDIVIKLWDDDGGLNLGGDLMDINPVNGKVELPIRFDTTTGSWDFPESDVVGYVARGDGDHGVPEANDGRIAQIEFEIFAGTNPDTDGDGIPDAIENNGVRRTDGSLAANLKSAGADPCRKSVVVWIDYMTGAADKHSHMPKPDAITDITGAFDRAPVDAASCPYGGTHKSKGIDFVYLQGKPVAEQAVMGLDDDYRDARKANFPPELRPYAHYAIFVHDREAGSSSSGVCCEKQDGYKDFIVSLGSWRIGTPDAQVGTARDQAGTIMHELGHALGLGHGGDEDNNYKPNYLSNMNYAFQLGIPRGSTPAGAATPPLILDYSSRVLASLDKNRLKESAGIGSGLTDWTRWIDGTGTERLGSAAGAIDWNGSRSIDDGTVDCGDGAHKDCVYVNLNSDDDSKTPKDVLTGYNDWANLKFRAIDSPTAGASHAAPHLDTPDLDYATALKTERTIIDFFDPDLSVSKAVDKTDAEGGDKLTYTVTVGNIGPGPAANVSLTDTFPAGQGKSPETITLGVVHPDEQRTETFTLTLACDIEDGTVLVNSATVSGKDMGGGTEENLANNTAAASTKVHAPKLQVTKAANGTGLAGEATTYKVVITNIGTASANKVTVKDVLPADVYYSKALDLGGGPKPNHVVYEADGTTALTWQLDSLPASGSVTLEYTARTSLLFLGGETVANAVEVTFQNVNGCTYKPVNAIAETTIKVAPPTRDPLSLGYWRNHSELWDAETLARIQATDQRFDTNKDGLLSFAETEAALAPGGNSTDATLLKQLIAAYFNLATRKINAATELNQKDKLVSQFGLKNVRDAIIYAKETLTLPATKNNNGRYGDTTTLLEQIDNNKLEVYG